MSHEACSSCGRRETRNGPFGAASAVHLPPASNRPTLAPARLHRDPWDNIMGRSKRFLKDFGESGENKGHFLACSPNASLSGDDATSDSLSDYRRRNTALAVGSLHMYMRMRVGRANAQRTPTNSGPLSDQRATRLVVTCPSVSRSPCLWSCPSSSLADRKRGPLMRA